MSGFSPGGTPRARSGGNAGACSVVETGEADKVVSDVSDTETSNVYRNVYRFDVSSAEGNRPLCSKRQPITVKRNHERRTFALFPGFPLAARLALEAVTDVFGDQA